MNVEKHSETRGWQLDHIAHAVRDIDRATAQLESFGGKIVHRERNELHKADIVFVRLGSSDIELLAPLPGNQLLERFLTKRGEALHHICYQVSSVSAELAWLSTQGVRLLDRAPRPGARGHHVAFLSPESTAGILIELCGNP